MSVKLYNPKYCPCPADCSRHGKCKECIEFHHPKGEQTYCEYLESKIDSEKLEHKNKEYPSGKEIRLLNYAPCAG